MEEVENNMFRRAQEPRNIFGIAPVDEIGHDVMTAHESVTYRAGWIEHSDCVVIVAHFANKE